MDIFVDLRERIEFPAQGMDRTKTYLVSKGKRLGDRVFITDMFFWGSWGFIERIFFMMRENVFKYQVVFYCNGRRNRAVFYEHKVLNQRQFDEHFHEEGVDDAYFSWNRGPPNPPANLAHFLSQPLKMQYEMAYEIVE